MACTRDKGIRCGMIAGSGENKDAILSKKRQTKNGEFVIDFVEPAVTEGICL